MGAVVNNRLEPLTLNTDQDRLNLLILATLAGIANEKGHFLNFARNNDLLAILADKCDFHNK